MAKTTSPVGEKITVRRRWLPWPHPTEELLLQWGTPKGMASWLSKGQRADRSLLAFGGVVFALLFLLGGTTVALILLGLGIITLVVVYLALPWRVEVLHGGQVVNSERVEGSRKTSQRVQQLADFYHSGALKVPSAPRSMPAAPLLPVPSTFKVEEKMVLAESVEPVTLNTNPLPEPEPQPAVVEELPAFELPTFEEPVFDMPALEEPVFAPPAELLEEPDSSFFVVEEGDPLEAAFPDAPKPLVPLTPGPPGETPLQRAVRLVEEEERALAERGLPPRRLVSEEEAKLAEKAAVIPRPSPR